MRHVLSLRCSLLSFAIFASCGLTATGADFPTPYPAPKTGERLTPPEEKRPLFNGAAVFGVRPGSPVFLPVSVSGERPMRLTAEGLPKGLRWDETRGVVTGRAPRGGAFRIALSASNAHGDATRAIEIRVGDTICLTPPMGWNSWYSFSEGVSAQNVLKTARLLAASGLSHYGYNYVNIDDCWQGERGGSYGAIQPNDRFPDMKALCRDIHRLGLRPGIYSTPWMGTYAGYIGGSMPNEQGDYSAWELPKENRSAPFQLFGRYPGVIKRHADQIGPVWKMEEDARQWAEWGFDYVKMDWNPNDVETTKRIADALKRSGRDIVLSLSNAAPYENAARLAQLANLWRTTGDISDNWTGIRRIASEQEKWQPLTRPGHWNDPDMLQIGRLGAPNRVNTSFQPTRLTPDEQYFQMTFWAIMSAPLLISCDLEELDDWTRGILCNREVIAVNQDFQGPAVKVWSKNGCEVWAKPLGENATAVGFFNKTDGKTTLNVPLRDLGFEQPARVRDAWRQHDAGAARGDMAVELNPHGAALFVLTPDA